MYVLDGNFTKIILTEIIYSTILFAKYYFNYKTGSNYSLEQGSPQAKLWSVKDLLATLNFFIITALKEITQIYLKWWFGLKYLMFARFLIWYINVFSPFISLLEISNANVDDYCFHAFYFYMKPMHRKVLIATLWNIYVS